MKRLFLLAGAAALLMGSVYTVGVGPGPMGHTHSISKEWVTYFEEPLDSSGVASATDLPATTPAPDIIWLADDPLVNNGSTGGTFTAAGAPGAVDSPFCPAANFTDISACTAAKSFDGTNDYYEITGGTWDGDADTGDVSVCAIHRPNEAAVAVNAIAGNNDDVDNDGWNIGYHGTLGTRMLVESDTPASLTSDEATLFLGSWGISCGTYDQSSNTISYMNDKAGVNQASPGDAVASDDNFRVGASGTSRYEGDIAAVFVWDDTELTAAQIRTITSHWMGVLPDPDAELSYEPTSHATVGNICCWTDATTPKLECFADDWPPVGCTVPPGLTGAGSDGGMLASISLTNRLKNSRDVSASWAEAGTLIGATSTANSPFRNAAHLPVTLLEDDAAGAAEYLTQGVDMTALNTGSKVVFVLYARSAAGTTGFDLRISEETICAGNLHDFDAVELSTTWTQFEFPFTVVDGTCTAMVAYIGPVSGAHPADFANAAEVGTAYGLFQLYWDLTYPSPVYIETAAAQATAGKTNIQWANTVAGLLAGAAENERMSIDVTLARSAVTYASSQVLFNNVGLTERIAGGATTLQWFDTGTTNLMSTAAPAYTTTGTTVTLMVGADWLLDEYELFEDDVSKDTSANADAPAAGANDMAIGALFGGTSGPVGAFLKNFKIERFE